MPWQNARAASSLEVADNGYRIKVKGIRVAARLFIFLSPMIGACAVDRKITITGSSIMSSSRSNTGLDEHRRKASSEERSYAIADWRGEQADVRVELRRVAGRLKYVLDGDLPGPVPPIRESRYLTREQHIAIYRWMLLNRSMEQALERLYKQGKVIGGLYCCRGQEATSCASAYALDKDDWFAQMIRNHGSCLVRGFSVAEIMMQFMGKAYGPTRGRDGTHWGDLGRNAVAPISTLGDLLPVLTGVALAARLQGRNIAAMTYLGDGGQSTGVTYEALNFAAVQKLGLVLFVENNCFAYSTPASFQYSVRDLAERAIAYNIPGLIIDGTDVCQVYDAAHEACERARRGEGPTLIEAKMMRMNGHGIHDGYTYVPTELLEFWERRDPLRRFESYLIKQKQWLSPEQHTEIVAGVEKQLEDARDAAESAPLPPAEEVAISVYCDSGHEIAFRYGPPHYPGERQDICSDSREPGAVHFS
jgi:TPP-dependent pyruvate/acetoin dehydrogenase alpha subunit